MAGIFTRAAAAVALWAALAAAAIAQGAPPYIASAWLQFGKLASPISAISSSAATQLPSGGNVGWLCNTGSNDAYVSFGTANTVTTSAATGSLLKTSSCAAYMLSQQTTPPTFYTWVATISASGTTIAVETGWGTPPAALVSSGGGGGGGSVTQGTVPWVTAVADTVQPFSLAAINVGQSLILAGANSAGFTIAGTWTGTVNGQIAKDNVPFTVTALSGTTMTVSSIAGLTPGQTITASAAVSPGTTIATAGCSGSTCTVTPSQTTFSGSQAAIANTWTSVQLVQESSPGTCPTNLINSTSFNGNYSFTGTGGAAAARVVMSTSPTGAAVGVLRASSMAPSGNALDCQVNVNLQSTGSVEIVDFNGTQKAAVLAASLQSASTNPSLVVQTNPNNPAIPAWGHGASNASSGVATSATNVGNVSYNYGWNGTTWDQLGSTAGSLNVSVRSSLDPCASNVATIKPFSITTNTTTNILTGTSGKKIYVCYLYLQTAAANNIAIIEGTTGATCGSGTAALVGGTTATNGLNNAANSGQAFGNGASSVMQTQTNNNDICIITSAATPLAGTLKYVLQ